MFTLAVAATKAGSAREEKMEVSFIVDSFTIGHDYSRKNCESINAAMVA